MFRIGRWSLTTALVLGAGLIHAAADEPREGRLKLVEAVPRDDLDATVSVAISPDGRFVYSASWQAATATVFARDASSGKLEHKQTTSDDVLAGSTALAISPDGRNVYAAATRSGAVASFRRDPETGKLTYLDTIPDGGEGGENGAAGIAVSPDGRFVYVATEDHKTISVFEREVEK